MLTNEQVEGLRVAFERLADPITEYIIKDVARRVSEAGQLTSTASYQIWRAQNLGMSQRQLKKELRKQLKVSHRELRKLLTQAAEVGYDFDIKHLPQVQAVPFHKNASVQQIVAAAIQLAQDDFTNLTQTLGFQTPDGSVHPMLTAYQRTTDFAFQQVITGATDYNTAIRQACTKLATGGVKYIDYASGVHTTLEAAIRRNMMGGLGLMVEQITQKNHDELGADGWEISAHANSAPDHEPIQGRQYTDAEYQALNGSLLRRIGTLNCGHNAFPVIIGVNQPQYTKAELEKFRQDNETGVTVDGKHYTGYEATQMQRKIERSIRAQKRRVTAAEALGDKDTLAAAKTKLTRLRQEYGRFSRAAGLRTEDERLFVAKPKAKAPVKPDQKPDAPVIEKKVAAGAAQKPAATQAPVRDHAVAPPAPENPEQVIVTNTPKKPENFTRGCSDVTREWLDSATPNSHEIRDATVFEQDGVVYRVDGVNVILSYDKHEKEIAELLERKLGGDIWMMPKVSGKYTGIETPDYRFRGERYDLKTMSNSQSKRAVYNALNPKQEQADNFVLDITNNPLGRQEIIRQIEEDLFRSSGTRGTKVIILVEDGDITKIFRRK